MTNQPDLISLPTGLQSAGDPVQTNPFAVDNPRHQVWNEATSTAEQESCRLRSDLARIRIENTEALSVAIMDVATGQFDIWARRGVHVVWSNEDIRAYDQWLYRYAESWLKNASESCPVPIRQEALLNELKLRLIERLEWWKGEARRYVAEQKVHRMRLDCTADADDGGKENRVGLAGAESLTSGATAGESHTAKTASGDLQSNITPAGLFPEPELAHDAASRELRLQGFMATHGATIADIAYSSTVHKPDFQQWRAGELGPKSVVSERIENVLSGRRSLKRKPHKRPIL